MSIGSGALALDATLAVEAPGVSDARLTNRIDRAVRRIEMATELRHAGHRELPSQLLSKDGRQLPQEGSAEMGAHG